MKIRVLMVVALLGAGVATADAAQKDSPKKVPSFYGALKFEQSENVHSSATFSGRVAPRPCRKDRNVFVSAPGNNAVGFDLTDARGRFSVASTFNPVANGKYKVSTPEKVIRRGGTKIICHAAKRIIRVRTNGSSQPRTDG